MSIVNKRTSLSTHFLLFGLLSLGAILVFSTIFWLQLYEEELKKKHTQLADESVRIHSVLSDTMDYITQYTAYIGERIAQHNNAHDLSYIASLINGSSNNLSSENKFYFTTTFDWVTPDKMLRVSNKIGILPTPFDMSERDYLRQTPKYPWTLQLSKPRLGGLSKQWIIPAGMGITGENGNFLGSITLGFALKGLERRIDQTLGHTDVHYLILTDKLEPVLDSSIDNAGGPDAHFGPAGLDAITPNSSGYLANPVTYNGTQFSYFRKLANYPYIVLSGYDVHMAQSLFNTIVLSRGLTLLGIICAMSAIFYWMRRRFIKPVVALADAADHIRQGKRAVIEGSPIHEINVLAAELQKISEYIENEHRINNELNQKTRQLETATKEALAARDSAVKANHAKSEFLANMSHELRTPLNAIVGLTNIMQLKRSTPERQKEYLETMAVSSQTLLDLINNLLDIAKIESENIQLEKASFNFRDALAEVTRILSASAQQKNIILSSHYDDSLPAFIIGDSIRLKQILINLVGNAIKFTEQGSITVSVARAGHNRMAIEVSDTGIGIPADKLETVFDKFSQADSSITRKYGGTGLGLALTKNLIECMGGSISVRSRLGHGSTFSVSIPLILGDTQSAALPASAFGGHGAYISPADSDTPLVLLVEDHKPNILVTTHLLENLGCQYEIACNGKDAIEKVKQRHFDIVLMDIQMPDMDGFNATRLIREYEKEQGRAPVSIIGLTAYALIGDREKCLAAGMNDYLSKPIDLEKFNGMIKGKSKKAVA